MIYTDLIQWKLKQVLLMNKEMINEAKDYIKPGSMSRNYKRFIQTGL